MTTAPKLRPLNSQNGIFRALEIELRPPQGSWKRIRGDEIMSHFLQHGTPYEMRVLNPNVVIGIGIAGEQIMTPTQYLPLRD